MTEEKKEIIECRTCINRNRTKEKYVCFNKDGELQFSFCNYQRDKNIKEE